MALKGLNKNDIEEDLVRTKEADNFINNFGKDVNKKKKKKVEEVLLNNKIPKDLHRKLKIKTAKEGVTIKKLLLDFIESYIDSK